MKGLFRCCDYYARMITTTAADLGQENAAMTAVYHTSSIQMNTE